MKYYQATEKLNAPHCPLAGLNMSIKKKSDGNKTHSNRETRIMVTHQSSKCPASFVIQKIQIAPTQIHKATNDSQQQS